MDGTAQKQELLMLPGDIPPLAIKQGHNIPWEKILRCSSNIMTLVVLITVTVAGIWLIKKFRPGTIKHI